MKKMHARKGPRHLFPYPGKKADRPAGSRGVRFFRQAEAKSGKPVGVVRENRRQNRARLLLLMALLLAAALLCGQPQASAATQPEATGAATQPEAASAAPQREAASAAPQPEAASAAPQPDAANAATQPDAANAAPQPEAASAAPQPETAGAVPELIWRTLQPGLELGLTTLPESRPLPAHSGRAPRQDACFVVLRIDPQRHSFTLSMASETGQARSLADWSREERLLAGINAAMYREDMLTSTGYMRRGDTVNNSRIGGRLGAFFVAGREEDGAPGADIIEKGSPGWEARLEEYAIVVQNYRLVSSDGRLLWPDAGQEHSMAVVSKDGAGNILFILSQQPLSVSRFTWYLQHLPLDLATVMYVEGGRQAGLFVRLPASADEQARSVPQEFPGATAYDVPGGSVHVWKGRQSLLGARGNPDATLPNIIGVRLP